MKEKTGLPDWLYPAGFWVALLALGLGIFVPSLSWLGVLWLGLLPVLATLWVAASSWQTDKRLSLSALAALAGLALVFVVRGQL